LQLFFFTKDIVGGMRVGQPRTQSVKADNSENPGEQPSEPGSEIYHAEAGQLAKLEEHHVQSGEMRNMQNKPVPTHDKSFNSNPNVGANRAIFQPNKLRN